MFDKLKNLFKPKEEAPVDLTFFLKNETSANLSERQQFLVSLAQIIGEHHNHYTNSLSAGSNIDFYAEKMSTWYQITDSGSAHEFIQTRLETGFRDYYNQIVGAFIQSGGTAHSLPLNHEERADMQMYFDNIKEVLKTREGQFWFTNGLDITDAYDCGRIAYVIRNSYTLGYLSETEAWEYLEEVGQIASEKFSSWNEYAKSYLLGRAIWCGDDGDFTNFSEVTRYLVSSPNSPWMKPFLSTM